MKIEKNETSTEEPISVLADLAEEVPYKSYVSWGRSSKLQNQELTLTPFYKPICRF